MSQGAAHQETGTSRGVPFAWPCAVHAPTGVAQAGAYEGLQGKANPQSVTPQGHGHPWLPEEGPGKGQQRLNVAVSVSGRTIYKPVGGNGDESEARGRKSSPEEHITPAHSALPWSHGGIPVREHPCPGGQWGTALLLGASAMAGGLQPPPHPWAPSLVHTTGAQLDPSSTVGPRGAGGGTARALGLALSSYFPPQPWASFAFWGSITLTPAPVSPRASSNPEKMAQLAARHRCSYRAAMETGTATPDLPPTANIVEAQAEFNQSTAWFKTPTLRLLCVSDEFHVKSGFARHKHSLSLETGTKGQSRATCTTHRKNQ